MLIAKNLNQLNKHLVFLEAGNKNVGFVATMGALHQGHLELIKSAVEVNDVSVCSIFVNPTQFNNPVDFEKYPRNYEEDIDLLKSSGLDILYFPEYVELYPKNKPKLLDFDDNFLFSIFEGKFRPGHFKGVVTVVMRLFEHVKPTRAYFGLKDYQQYVVIKKATQFFYKNIEVVGVPTVRNTAGLALSSRNKRLNDQELVRAEVISRTLCTFKEFKYKKPIEELVAEGMNQLQLSGMNAEYLALCNADTLEMLTDWNQASNYIAVCAASINDVRLIDNLLFAN